MNYTDFNPYMIRERNEGLRAAGRGWEGGCSPSAASRASY
jgi:hypothetical protein